MFMREGEWLSASLFDSRYMLLDMADSIKFTPDEIVRIWSLMALDETIVREHKRNVAGLAELANEIRNAKRTKQTLTRRLANLRKSTLKKRK
jgi:hypothetical protein